jgi:hypothetical protein
VTVLPVPSGTGRLHENHSAGGQFACNHETAIAIRKWAEESSPLLN